MLHVTVSRLRQKLAKISGAAMIRTASGAGYEFVPDASLGDGNAT